MKPLKDIGREVVELSDMEFVDPDTVDWGDEPETPKFTVYSIDERRELVREFVRRFVIDNLVSTDETEAEAERQADVYLKWADELIKSEGL